MMEATVDAIRRFANGAGDRAGEPTKLHGDKGYDFGVSGGRCGRAGLFRDWRGAASNRRRDWGDIAGWWNARIRG